MVQTHFIYLRQGESILGVDQDKSLELPQESTWNGLYLHRPTQTGVRKCLMGPTLQKRYFNLERVQRKAARFCLQTFNKTASVTDMLFDLKWDTLETRRKKKRLTLMYKLSHNLVDINTEEHLIPKREKRTRNSHGFKYRMPKVSKDVFKFFFFPRSITEWNWLATDLVNCTSLSDFKLNLGKYVIYLVIWTFLLLCNLFICTYIYIYIYIFLYISYFTFYL